MTKRKAKNKEKTKQTPSITKSLGTDVQQEKGQNVLFLMKNKASQFCWKCLIWKHFLVIYILILALQCYLISRWDDKTMMSSETLFNVHHTISIDSYLLAWIILVVLKLDYLALMKIHSITCLIYSTMIYVWYISIISCESVGQGRHQDCSKEDMAGMSPLGFAANMEFFSWIRCWYSCTRNFRFVFITRLQ